MAKLEWNPRGKEQFTANFDHALPSGITLASAEVELQKRTSRNPDVWAAVAGVTVNSPTIVADTYTGAADSAVLWSMTRDEDADPQPGDGEYRFWVRAVGSDGYDYVAKPSVELIP